jgi:hypothetical protein
MGARLGQTRASGRCCRPVDPCGRLSVSSKCGDEVAVRLKVLNGTVEDDHPHTLAPRAATIVAGAAIFSGPNIAKGSMSKATRQRAAERRSKRIGVVGLLSYINSLRRRLSRIDPGSTEK